MKPLSLLFDSLNRNALSCYNDEAPPTPNFDRIAQRGTVFDTHYAGSLPCMPARWRTRAVLYVLATDPGQSKPVDAPEVEARLSAAMTALMHQPLLP